MRRMVVLFSVLLVGGGVVSAQNGISACVNPVGQMRLLDEGTACRDQERLVTWAVQGPSGPPGPEGPSGASGLRVVDANGAQMGWFSSPVVVMHINNYWFTVFPQRDGFSGPSFGFNFSFLTADCSGQRYLSGAAAGLVANAQVFNQQAVFPDYEGVRVVITGTPQTPGMSWTQQIGASGPLTPCVPSPVFGTLTLFPARSVDLSGFVPPFRLTE